MSRALCNSKFIAHDDVKLHTISLGAGEPVVMIHGLGVGNISSWYLPYAEPLARHNQVILYDQRGHGLSSRPSTGYDPDTLAQDLRHILDYYQVENVKIIAHSYGAIVAMHYAQNYSQGSAVKKLTLIDAPYPISDFVLPQLNQLRSEDDILRQFPLPIRQEYHRGRRSVVKMVDSVKALFWRTDLIQEINSSASLDSNLLKSLAIPMHAIYGQHSYCIAALQQLKKLFHHCQTSLLPCGHYVLNEDVSGLQKILFDQHNFEMAA